MRGAPRGAPTRTGSPALRPPHSSIHGSILAASQLAALARAAPVDPSARRASAAAMALLGPGAMTEYSAPSRGRRARGTCYVDEPAVGFFATPRAMIAAGRVAAAACVMHHGGPEAARTLGRPQSKFEPSTSDADACLRPTCVMIHVLVHTSRSRAGRGLVHRRHERHLRKKRPLRAAAARGRHGVRAPRPSGMKS